jgi:hypothetical protein
MSPWGAGCGNLITWPLRYLAQAKQKAVLGGWDPSCRKYLKTDELSFTMPWDMFKAMVEIWPETFLGHKAWGVVRKKIERSARTWEEK